MSLIDNIVTDHNQKKKKFYPSLGRWNYVKIVVFWTTGDIKKTNALAWADQRIDFWWTSGGLAPPNYVEIFVS